jgi:hypothetical protein
LVGMEPETDPARAWEDVVHLARRIDHGVAARQGVDNDQVLRLARAVLAFHGRLASGAVLPPKVDPIANEAVAPPKVDPPSDGGQSAG